MKIYTTKSKYNCGPCSFINLTGIKGTKKLEKSLSKVGKLKPFHASSYTAFLIWGKKYNKKLTVYSSSKKLNNKIIDFMIRYEKIPKELQERYKNLAIKRFEKLNKKFSSKIKKLQDPIKKLDFLLKKENKVAVLTSSYYIKGKVAPHWIVAYKKEKNKYYFMCSKKGIVVFTKKDLLKGFKLNKKEGYCPVLIAYKR